MDLITNLPRTPKNVDAIWEIVDRLTKSGHFISINESSTSKKLADIYVKKVVARHGVPVMVISHCVRPSDRWQSKRLIQTLEDILKACVLDFGGSWDTYLPLAELSYINNYHANIGMPPYEMLYGRRCRTPICWGEGPMGASQGVRVDVGTELRDEVKLSGALPCLSDFGDEILVLELVLMVIQVHVLDIIHRVWFVLTERKA
ncbi:hypothetical protein OSB04_024872 [Centaurea solstitialis]|uniref:Integrase catalytic domain-containing protein n=1 Tax=Centaurea solstitialis TaxID=347529 RepID=A0AA38WAT0_9ASTR|nr:hypothetical protein OSB04_024872 [Centaurea solstitialis]